MPYRTQHKGGKAGRWSKSGTVVEVLPFEAYHVRIHGSRLLSKRNRIHLRKISPFVAEERIIPHICPDLLEAADGQTTEESERYVVIQPSRRQEDWVKLSPEAHRRRPEGHPGENIVKKKLKEQETVSNVRDSSR